jgi:phospholipase C
VPVEDQATCTTKEVPPCFDIPSVPDVLPEGTSWKFYGSQQFVLTEVWSMFDAIHSVRRGPGWKNVVPLKQFAADVKAGTLPAVSWVVPEDFVSDHPMIGSICEGENETVELVNAVMQSPMWKDTAILITTDDFGGWYDHVPPPRQDGCDARAPTGLGFRLPLIIVSPYAKPGFVFHEQAEQASVPRFIEKVFGATQTLSDLDPAAKDGQANDLMNAFDFTQEPLAPLVLTTRACP